MPCGIFKHPKQATCENCKATYPKYHAKQKFCSVNCRIQASNRRHKPKRKPHACRWCGQQFMVNFSPNPRKWYRPHCYKPECEKRQWLYTLIMRFKRCRDCQSITPRITMNKWGSHTYCPFCVGSINSKIREDYLKWLANLPKYVEPLLPKTTVPLKQAKQYVKAYDINSLRFQTYYPNQQKEGENNG